MARCVASSVGWMRTEVLPLHCKERNDGKASRYAEARARTATFPALVVRTASMVSTAKPMFPLPPFESHLHHRRCESICRAIVRGAPRHETNFPVRRHALCGCFRRAG